MGVLIIAEAGVNHNGSLVLAKQMIRAAKESGADIIKFQTFRAEHMISKYAPKAEYQKETTDGAESQLQMVKKLELTFEEFRELKEDCKAEEIGFLSAPFDLESIACLQELGVDLWKIPSGEITNLPYLIEIAKTGKEILLSTGMSEAHEIKEAMEIIKSHGGGAVSLLHCNTEYPTPFEDANLAAIKGLRMQFGVRTGYSDHTLGVEAAVAAAAMGALIIEKHFTLDKTMEGPDHRISLEPHELKNMVSMIRNVEKAIGDGIKRVSPSEARNKLAARKSIVAKRFIGKGEVFTKEAITVKRPGNGISPMKWFEVIGKTADQDYQEDELLKIKELQE